MGSTHRLAEYWHRESGKDVMCDLCPHHCVLGVGKRGRCMSRQNVDGDLIAINYNKSIAVAIDPIEKKPLYHFYPGSQIISLGPNSCNLNCFFCQNYTSSQRIAVTQNTSPERIQEYLCQNPKLKKQVAFTYTEPITWYEYIVDFAAACKEVDIVLVSNGFIEEEPLDRLLPLVSAMNIDLKAIRNDFYEKHCGGSLATVLRTIKKSFEHDIHLEITNLLIPGLNDTDAEIEELAGFIASVSNTIPLHISAYHPAYKSDIVRTPTESIDNACKIARHFLKYVYAGNTSLSGYRDTSCPVCGNLIISRDGYSIKVIPGALNNGCCSKCSTKIYGVFE